MLYLIPWFAILAFALLGLPIVALLEKKKNASVDAAAWDNNDSTQQESDVASDSATDAEFGDGGGFGQAPEAAGTESGDFPVFDEQFN